MKIDCHNGWFKGLGDIVCYAWIGQALLAHDRKGVEFYATGWRADVLRMFQMPVTDDPTDAVHTTHGYEEAIEQGSQLNYVEWIAHHHGAREIVPCYMRPKANIMPMDREYGRQAGADVLVFPDGVWATRVWPRSYYVELVHMLHEAGIKVKVITQKRDYAYDFVHCIYDQTLPFISAAIQRARLVIGNDSGPAHLSGTLGTRTIAIHGPTRECIYAHIPEVTSLRKVSVGCAGCHALPNKVDPMLGWRRACQFGCAELYRTHPEDVFLLATQMLGMVHRQTVSVPALTCQIGPQRDRHYSPMEAA